MPSKEELQRIADELQRLAKLLTGEGSTESDTPVTGPQAVAESEPVPDWLKRARALLKDRIELPKGSHLTLGLAPGGSALVEQGDPDGGQLPVPEGPGPWVVGWLDPEPERMFGHPVQLLWLHPDTKQLKIRNGMFPPMLKVAGPAVPFSGGSVVPDGGAQIVWGHGHIGVGWPVSISSPSQIPSFIPNWPAVLGPCQKTALVIDLGDSSRYFGLRGTMADDADKMGAWLRGQNFSVRRISQDDRSPHPSLRRSRMRATLISEIAARLSTLPIVFPPGRCCHEFFLYIKAHGYKRRSARPASGSTPTGSSRPGGLGMYSRDGNRNEHIDFFTLLSPLATRTDVRSIVFIDSCFSGDAVVTWTTHFNQMPHPCGVVVLSTCSPANTTWGGRFFESGTQSFLEPNIGDLDQDGTPGDLRDRFRHMRDDTGNGARAHGPADWGSLD